jgi:hypothetical protein
MSLNKTTEDQILQNNFEHYELEQNLIEDFWTRDILMKILNDTYYLNESDISKTLLFINKVTEWVPINEEFINHYSWSPQEHVERALLYGKPKTIEDLIKLLLPSRKGLWEHKMITKADIVRNNITKQNQKSYGKLKNVIL